MDKNIIQFVKDNSYFSSESEEDDDSYEFTTRAHSSIFNEQYGEEDFREAMRLKKLIIKEFPSYKVTIDTFDEWVNIIVE
jgi:hypothetical protein